jgi:hypothetical protein
LLLLLFGCTGALLPLLLALLLLPLPLLGGECCGESLFCGELLPFDDDEDEPLFVLLLLPPLLLPFNKELRVRL